jgi:hypothetical protein
MSDHDPYADLKRHALSAETMPVTNKRETAAKPARKRMARSSGPFVKAPIPWIYKAMLALGCPQAAVVLRACFQMRFGDTTIRLTAAGVRDCGASTDTRRRALATLEAAGLARIDWQDRAGPLVTWLDGSSPQLPPTLANGLIELSRSTGQRMLRPRQVLAALPKPADHTGAWPQTTRQLLKTLRRVDPRYVVMRKGMRWVVLNPAAE